MKTTRTQPWRKSSHSAHNRNCIEATCLHTIPYRKSSHSNGSGNGNCVEAGCVHDATYRKSSRSTNNGTCVEAAAVSTTVAIRDSKLDTTCDFPTLSMSGDDWAGLLTAIRTGHLSR
jgi:hypothetical protein